METWEIVNEMCTKMNGCEPCKYCPESRLICKIQLYLDSKCPYRWTINNHPENELIDKAVSDLEKMM